MGRVISYSPKWSKKAAIIMMFWHLHSLRVMRKPIRPWMWTVPTQHKKLALLAHLAFGRWVHWATIPRYGLETVDQELLRFADELGYRIRVVADANHRGDLLSLRVGPALVRKGTPLAETQGAFNSVSVVGDAVGPLFFHGLGAGQMPTASAVVADLIGTVVGRSAITFQQASKAGVSVTDCTDFSGGNSPIFMRLHVTDAPGVLADLTGILGAEGISIDSVIQHPADKGQQGCL